MKAVLFAAVSAAAILTLAACGSGTSAPGDSSSAMPSGMSMPATSAPAGSAASGPHNSADADFATNMIPHHQQAIDMADLALTKSANADVKRFATRIKAAQSPEINAMTGWLTAWKVPVPTTSMDHAMPGMAMPGQMSDADMAALRRATGAAFDKMWLELMIKHHDGAIDMAKTELSEGQNASAKSLAQSIIAGQSAEIAQFRKLLPTVGA